MLPKIPKRSGSVCVPSTRRAPASIPKVAGNAMRKTKSSVVISLITSLTDRGIFGILVKSTPRRSGITACNCDLVISLGIIP